MTADIAHKQAWHRLSRWAGFLAWAVYSTPYASTLNDGVTPDVSNIPKPGDVLLSIVDNAEGDSPNAGKTLFINTHWSYADLVSGVTLPQLDLSSDPNYAAIQNDPLTYNLVAAYALYQNPETGKSNLDKNGVGLPFDDDVPGNVQWGLVSTGQAAGNFSADGNDLGNTLINGVQSYWNSVNTALAALGATATGGADSALVATDDPAAWETASWSTLGGSGVILGDPDNPASTAIDGVGTEGKVFWISNPTLATPDDPNPANTVTELGTVRLTAGGQLAYTVAGGTEPPPPTNNPPVVKIATPDPVATGTTATLDGSGSGDPDRGNTLSYAWTQTGGPATVALSGAGTAIASFKATAIGGYSFALTVTDNKGASATASVNVTVTPPVNHPPVAVVAPATATVNNGSVVSLDASASTDPDAGDILAYRWRWVSGPVTPTLSGADGVNAKFKADAVGDYVFELTVTDNRGASATATARIAVDANRAPVARADFEPRVGKGSTVTLDGGGSSDPDGDALVYAWIPVSGPVSVKPDGANSAVASFVAASPGIYVFKLIVADGQGAGAETLATVKAGPGVTLNAPTGWLVGRAQTIGVTGFQAQEKAKVKLRFSADGQRYKPLARIALKQGGYVWKPGKKHLSKQGAIQACLDIDKAETCDQIGNISVKSLPR